MAKHSEPRFSIGVDFGTNMADGTTERACDYGTSIFVGQAFS